jgi:Gly-Xaa carboxypeptidase
MTLDVNHAISSEGCPICPLSYIPIVKSRTMSEKASLPMANEVFSLGTSTPKRANRFLLPTLVFLGLIFYLATQTDTSHHCHHQPKYSAADLASAKCPAQPSALDIGHHWDPNTDIEYAGRAARRLSKAVQIRTESYDDMPIDPTHERWDKMNAFSEMLETGFPRVYAALEHQYINTHGHLFTWKGTNESLQPILLTAHVDTVPVLQDTVGLWRYPPFEGTVTVNGTDDTPGTWIWGRGSSDCKNSLMGILGAVERLVTEEHTPERTVVLAFGFDEEVSKLSETNVAGADMNADWWSQRSSTPHQSNDRPMGQRFVRIPNRRRILRSLE